MSCRPPLRFSSWVAADKFVVPDHGRDGAKRPDRTLEPRDERFKGLAGGQRDVRPAAEAEDPLEEQMREALALDRHAQIAGVREIERALAARDGVRNCPFSSGRAGWSRTRRDRQI